MDTPIDPVELLMTKCLDRPPAAWAQAVEQACLEQPELADELRERMGLVARLGKGLVDSPFPERLGEFLLEERIGGGGMGVVYRAHQQNLDRRVAIKLIRPDLVWFERPRERFQREVEAIAKLSHPGIVPIYSVGEERGVPYFAMELLPGTTLAEVKQRLRERAPESLRGEDLWECTLGTGEAAGPVPQVFRSGWPEACLALIAQVARALAHAHSNGLLHRDVKPSNIMVQPGGRAVLMDFGLTASSDSGDERITRSGTQVGTLIYMSQEQLGGESELDARTDVYSLGVTLYELLTLQQPYEGDDEASLRSQIRNALPTPIRARNRRVSVDAQTVCMRAIERSRSDRYASAEAFAQDLEAAYEHRPIHARPPRRLQRALRWMQRRPLELAAACLATMLLIGIPLTMWAVEASNRKAIETSFQAERAAKLQAEGAQRDLKAALAEQQRLSENAAQSSREAIRQQKNAEAAHQAALASNETQSDVMQFLVDVLQGAYPGFHGGRQPSIDEMLAHAERHAQERLGARPHSLARISMTLGVVFNSLGRQGESRVHLSQAVERLRGLEDSPPRNRDLAQSLSVLGRIHAHGGDPEQGLEELREAVQLAEKSLPAGDPQLLRFLHELAELHQYRREPEACLQLRRRAQEYAQAHLQDQPEWIAKTTFALGFSLFQSGRKLEGQPLMDQGLASLREHASPLDKELIQSILRASKVPADQGDFRAARSRLEEGLVLARQVWGKDSGTVLSAELEALNYALYLGDYDAAIEGFQAWLQRAGASRSATNDDMVSARFNLAKALYQTQRFPQLIEFAETSEHLTHTRAAWGESSPRLVTLLQQLADAHLRENRLEEGFQLLEELVQVLETIPHAKGDLLIQLFTLQGLGYHLHQDPLEARQTLEHMLELCQGEEPVMLFLDDRNGRREDVATRALRELIALGNTSGWTDDVERWRASLDARSKD